MVWIRTEKRRAAPLASSAFARGLHHRDRVAASQRARIHQRPAFQTHGPSCEIVPAGRPARLPNPRIGFWTLLTHWPPVRFGGLNGMVRRFEVSLEAEQPWRWYRKEDHQHDSRHDRH